MGTKHPEDFGKPTTFLETVVPVPNNAPFLTALGKGAATFLVESFGLVAHEGVKTLQKILAEVAAKEAAKASSKVAAKEAAKASSKWGAWGYGVGAGVVVELVFLGANYYCANVKLERGEITQQEYDRHMTKRVGSAALSFVCSAAGSAIGTAVIPIPILGSVAGSVLGGVVGDFLCSTLFLPEVCAL